MSVVTDALKSKQSNQEKVMTDTQVIETVGVSQKATL
jgi:hypothetical protein